MKAGFLNIEGILAAGTEDLQETVGLDAEAAQKIREAAEAAQEGAKAKEKVTQDKEEGAKGEKEDESS